MYIVKLYNDGIETEIHGEKSKLKSGSLVKGLNAIDSFSFVMTPANKGFNSIRDYKTLVTIYNTNKNRFEFYGRVLYSSPEMDSSGFITKEVMCESYLGFLCDSKQKYVTERNWTVRELLEHIISTHNEQMEEYKHIELGEVTAEENNDNLFLGIQRDSSWDTIKSKLLDNVNGDIRLRVATGVTYIDHLASLGTMRTTKIELSRNMKTIRQENDPTSYISRLIPLGAKIKDEDGNETEERVGIESVNDGLPYIEDVDAKEAHGIRVEYVYFDDINSPTILKTKGEAYLIEHNRIKVQYSATAVDLSLLGLDIDDFEVGDSYRIINGLLAVNDVARIIKKTINVCDQTKTSINFGDKFKTLSETQAEQSGKVNNLENSVGKIESSYVHTNEFISEKTNTSSMISQTTDNILMSVEELYAKKSTLEETSKTITSQLELLADSLNLRFTETEEKISNVDGNLQSKLNEIAKYFSFTINGLEIGATYIDENGEEKKSDNKVVIDHDDITIYASGVIVQEFKADGTSLIPILKITKTLDLLGLKITEDDTHINCDYLGG